MLTVTACNSVGTSTPDTTESSSSAHTAPAYPGTDAGIRSLLRDIRADDANDVIRSLKPTAADYRSLFEEGFAARAEKMYDAKLWSTAIPSLPAEPGQTEVSISKATTDDIRAWRGTAMELPGGYQEIRAHVKPGLTIYAWEYREPGSTSGMSYNGLSYVNGHWVWVPEPWRALDEQP
jgi:hypothetical protein